VDLLTYLLATRAFIGRDRNMLLAGIALDLAFYSTYPLRALHRGHARPVIDGGAWPAPPQRQRESTNVIELTDLALA